MNSARQMIHLRDHNPARLFSPGGEPEQKQPQSLKRAYGHGVRKPRRLAMPVEPDPRGSIPEGLSHPFEKYSDPVAIAGELVRLVQDLATVLTPILGNRGVAALYQRSLHVTRARHPWVAGPVEVAQPIIDLVALRAQFAHQERDEAATAATALLQAFHHLLASLIGYPLAERLLDPVWAHSLRRPTAQDTTP